MRVSTHVDSCRCDACIDARRCVSMVSRCVTYLRVDTDPYPYPLQLAQIYNGCDQGMGGGCVEAR